MTDADDITSLQAQLAAHRRTLVLLLRQLANLGADHAPPGVHNGIAQARAAIARLKAALRAAGVAVEDQASDEATPDKEAGAASVPARTVNIHGDQVAGDKIGGDKVMGDKHIHNYPQPRPIIDPTQAQQQLNRLPLDQIPDLAPLPQSPEGGL